ncbi:putative uncharacterized protein [Clostridium sp. CAG:122]|nr:putative uncharacterized protein [Clostridium sp. CAG:122]
MAKKVVAIGKQAFDSVIENDCFYIDKTSFIKEWWENKDDVTLITRPRRKDEKYRKLQGTYPVMFLSFAKIKQNTYKSAVKQIKNEYMER